MLAWSAVAEFVPLYPLYALLFADTRLDDRDISALLALWSATAVLAEVPSGAFADRFSRRGALVTAGVLQAAGYLLWAALPGFPGFAAGFVVWAVGGALVSGSFEALLHDGLAAAGAAGQFGRVYGWVNAVDLLVQVPTALAAAALFSVGGFPLVGWASVATCLAAAGLAARLPEAFHGTENPDGDGPGWWDILSAGVTEAAGRPAVRTAVLLVVLLGGLDAMEEYFPLLARDWGVPDAANPLVLLGVPLAGAVGAALGGRAASWPRSAVTVALATAGFALVAAAVLAVPAGLGAVAAGYALYRLVLVVAETRLQEAITGPARATVTSMAGLGVELAALALFAAYATGGLVLVAGAVLLLAAALPRLIRP
ncbi:Predicted arabinose efflux permease, MFS family [Modestobacter sp. DSM 44400]|uniref:MFS transporter n=1 Tax=Modestobacter sp. DSM 44400 TaxID=1550230 RepID=UPI0008970417|nr:MFS transporter [Modestobacter sp. DSM 44400]SDY46184.1 Predicted arabinose efflux permease, MFS family [Modestobacter sp. DSM 44400]